MSLVSEFKDFALKGNVIDLAVGVVIGGAFGKLVEGVVGGVINPIVATVTGKGSTDAILAGFGQLGTGVMNFLILAAVVFFVFVKPMNKLKAITARKVQDAPAPPVPQDVALLMEIRDALKGKTQA
ncbi:MAG: large-conductance mechanosensitive channel protein [Verrucomicrobiaceae bacterium]|nr:large-conductance mechanosensitive channel protein [Verrucomicrobiaceae bacterium]MDB6120434.1 large-conductance mechanosensitive channel protein [Verrucomicrobiaceae bacterium]